jgi:molybdopterin-guanine dinucleotide biosynthesis protein
MLKKIILITAKAESGKDTVSDYLTQQLKNKGQKVAIMHFAQYIKQILIQHYEWDGITKDEYWRHKLQYLGTEKIRLQMNKPLFHVSRVCEDIEIIQDDFDYVLIPDCRFPNEAYHTMACFPKQGTVLRIERPNFKNRLTEAQRNHISETSMDNFNYNNVLYNDGTLQDLHMKIDKYINDVLGIK